MYKALLLPHFYYQGYIPRSGGALSITDGTPGIYLKYESISPYTVRTVYHPVTWKMNTENTSTCHKVVTTFRLFINFTYIFSHVICTNVHLW